MPNSWWAIFQEARHVAQLDLVIVFVGTRAQLDFLHLHLFLLQLGFVGALLLLVFEFAVIHDAANRRLRRGGDLDQIDAGFLSHLQRLAQIDDAKLFPVQTLETNLRYRYLIVDTMGLVLSYGKTPEISIS
jgi:hypothetical protein